MTYDLNPLGYAGNALEPYVSGARLAAHRNTVHRSYTDALNRMIAAHPELGGKTVEDLLRGLDAVPGAIRQQLGHLAGGHANHQFLWKILAPRGAGGPDRPVGALAAEIDAAFGSFAGFREAFEAAAAGLGVEGWAFLSLSRPRTGTLEILALPGNGSVLPIAKPGITICDLWDHAWDGAAFPAYWDVIDWTVCDDRYVGLREGKTHL